MTRKNPYVSVEKGKVILHNRLCVICGKFFDVRLRKGGKIPKKYFYGKNLGERLGEHFGKDFEYWECELCAAKK